ncbi:hypothetical protein PMZ80_002123 [Knufia obscura]|uniref:Uncharacterized protein n=2 Tax=Knufia TaxID=430999 RepID=A0AAN8F9J1_9EURO|nr:hypothetical protein PMZ80_002123 [Knufia obscura]KAK5953936.1 hypothetical protein OHC33_005207 [Knufia fluminis]
MPSSKGEPDNPELREKVKEEVKQMSKGGGPGSWSAWKAGELARQYEAKGGGYKDKGDHKNKSERGAPQPKDPKDKKESAPEKAHREKVEREKKDSDGGQKKEEGKKEEGKATGGKKGGSKKK